MIFEIQFDYYYFICIKVDIQTFAIFFENLRLEVLFTRYPIIKITQIFSKIKILSFGFMKDTANFELFQQIDTQNF